MSEYITISGKNQSINIPKDNITLAEIKTTDDDVRVICLGYTDKQSELKLIWINEAEDPNGFLAASDFMFNDLDYGGYKTKYI
jgi:hypothetical protein